MIEIKKIKKKYMDDYVLNGFSLKLPRYGLVALCGPSGCGKTTLLNCLGGLLDFEGSVEIDGRKLEKMSDDDKSLFRLKNVGFVFQDFKLFESQNVFDNIALPLKTLTNYNERKIKRKVRDLLEIVGLEGYSKRIVNSLSGGEKQRISIARAFANNPKVILADEPTGSLDNENSEKIMSLLQTISKKSLVLVVTHDEELAEKYSDQIIYLEDGVIKKIKHIEKESYESFVPIEEMETSNKKASIPMDFVFNHVFQNIKFKKIRSSISFMFMSLGLLGIGLSIAFSSSISKDIKRSYSNLIESSEINISKKEMYNANFVSLNKSDALNLKNKYKSYIDDVGVIYEADFESFFKDLNVIKFFDGKNYHELEGLSARSVNEFWWLEEVNTEIFPNNISYIENDEVLLGLTINQVRTICFYLNIEKSIVALSNYLENNSIPIILDLENDDWEYTDQQIFNIIGFTLTNNPFIVNSNHLWNEEILENRMRFPTDKTNEITQYPWVMKKLTYFKTYNPYTFVNAIRDDDTFYGSSFDLCDKKFFPVRYLNSNSEEIDKIIIYYGEKNYFTKKDISYIKEADSNIENEIWYNPSSYLSFPSSLLNGFGFKTYFSFDYDLLNETLENNSSIKIEENETEVLPDHIIVSDFSKNFENPVKFNSKYGKFISGREPMDIDEIVISSGLLGLLSDKDLSSEYLNVATVINEINENNGVFVRDYKINKIKIVGIVDSAKLRIYHQPNWNYDFYLLRLGLSASALVPTSVSFSFKDETKANETIANLNRAFPYLDIINPLISINESIDDLCNIMSIFVLCISFVALVISMILVLACNYLHLQDCKKEIALTRCLGITKQESLKFLYAFSGVSSFISLIISIFELIIVCLVVGMSSSKELSLNFEFNFDPIAILVMVVVAFIVWVLVSLVFGKNVKKIEPSECLKT